VGPYREKEGSFYTVRQIWSPVQIAVQVLPPDFSGTLEVENHYDQTDLDTVRFRWRLVRFDLGSTDAGHRVLSEGSATTGSIAAHTAGTLPLGLPADRQGAHALLLDAYDASERLIAQWSWMLRSPGELRAEFVDPTSPAPAVATDGAESVSVAAAGRVYAFSKASAQLTSVSVEGQPLSFGNGPSLSVGTSTLESFDARQEGGDHVISATFSGDLRSITWRVLGNGWLSLSYEYRLVGNYDFFGVDFDYPEARLRSVQWLGRGPSRVWKNRMRGPWHDLWQRDKNDAITGQRWDYPEFKGYFADTYFARFQTTEGSFEVVMDSPDLFLRLYTPENGVNPQTAAMSFPGRDISFLHGIPAIGDKFLPPSQLGPQSQQHVLNGDFRATLYFRFAR
jgi:hypothetical protein